MSWRNGKSDGEIRYGVDSGYALADGDNSAYPPCHLTPAQ
jgi:hypothetical protein